MDYDGVLVDSLGPIMTIYNELAGIFGVEKVFVSGEDFHADFTLTLAELGVTSNEDIEKAREHYRSRMKVLREKIQLFPFIFDFLKSLKGHTLAIASNNDSEYVKSKLVEFGVDKYFAKVYSPGEYKPKPAPDMLLAAMDDLGFTKDDTYFIGDMDGDVKAAKNAKVPSIIVGWGFHSKEKLKDADYFVETIEELKGVLK